MGAMDPAALPDCRFAGLRLEADDAPALATFWAGVLGREAITAEGGSWRVAPRPDPAGSVVLDVCPAPGPRASATRTRLDVQLAVHDVDVLLAAGARLVRSPGDGGSWWVMADPEGNEFHAMPPPPPELHVPPVDEPTPFELVVPSEDPAEQAAWWAARTGGTARTRQGATFWWVDRAAGFPLMFWMFTLATGPRAGRDRLRWDVELAGGSPRPLLDAGAALVPDAGDDLDGWVLTDPEGNVFRALPPDA
jgi:hypothetical protein